MNENLARQKKYWDTQVIEFDSIYSQKKNKLMVMLDQVFRWDMQARYDYTLKNSEPIENRTLLDVGCGTARFALEFAKRRAKKVVGIDISKRMIDICKIRASEENLNHTCSFIQTDLLHYHPETKFDITIGIGLFDYIKEPLPVLKKMEEHTSQKVIVSFPRALTARALFRKARLGIKHCDVYFFTRKRLIKLLKQAGFHKYTISVIGQLFCVTAFPKQDNT